MSTVPVKADRTHGPHIPLRVHIVPMGFEEDRVVLAAVELKAERVIILANTEAADKAGRFRAKVIRRLRDARIDYAVERAPIFMLDDTMNLFVKLLRANRAEQLFINISAGSKVQAVAGLLAAMIVRAEGIDATVYYVEPGKYTDDPPSTPISSGLRQILEIPALTLPTPPRVAKVAIQFISKRPYSKLELALALSRRGELDPDRLTTDGRPKNERARVALQSAVDQRVIQPLLSQGYLQTEKRGRKVMVSLTDSGRQASKLFIEA
jgi:hypothetical protein